jgi:prophage DNA circulation protein
MSWRDEIRTHEIVTGRRSDGSQIVRRLIGASFRGVPFFVDTADRSGGRRAVVHEFPLRDDPYVEDLGRKARTFRIEGYVVGSEYITQRNKLLAALEDDSAPGEFVHPYYGQVTAVCVSVASRESKADGGLATFSIEFVEAPNQSVAPTVVVDAAGQVASKADAAIEATAAELAEEFDPAGLPAFALESAETALSTAAASLGEKLGPVISDTQEAAMLTSRVALLTTRANSLVRAPADVITEFRDTIIDLAETILAAPSEVMFALIDAYAVDLGPAVEPTTTTRARELGNQTALVGALRRVIAIEAARLAPLVTYASAEEATAARDQLAAMLEEQAGEAGDTAYPGLVNLRSEVLRAVPGGAALARVVTVERKVSIPSLVLAHQLYGSVEREADIIARNRIRHPGFVLGAVKVLTDE